MNRDTTIDEQKIIIKEQALKIDQLQKDNVNLQLELELDKLNQDPSLTLGFPDIVSFEESNMDIKD